MRKLWKHFEVRDRDLNLDECGIHQFEEGEYYEYNAYQNFVLHYVNAGKGIFTVNNKTYSLSAGDAFIVRKGYQVHYCAENSQPMETYWVGLSGDILEDNLINTTLSYLDKAFFSIDSKIPEIMIEICNKALINEKQQMNDIWYLSKIYLLLHYIVNEFLITETKDERLLVDAGEYAEVAYNYIYHNYMNRITIKEVAKYIGISRSHLFRIFKEAYDFSPQQYLTNLRMETASSMLQDTEDKIKDISMKIGYPNQLQFSKQFKTFFGVSPTKYRQLKKKMGYRLK